MRAGAVVLALVGGGLGLAGLACGDNLAGDAVVTAVSGTRLAVHRFRYTDGSEQTGVELYDKVEHTLCTADRWTDGVDRCVPIADEAVFVDAACHDAVGRRLGTDDPTHFIGYDWIQRRRFPARLYRAGRVTTPITEFYEQQDGVCAGPFPGGGGLAYHTLTGEVAAASLLELHDDEVGDGRLGLTVRTADDGLRLPLGLYDRDLDLPCTPTVGPDGAVACAPTTADAAAFFSDPECERPAVIVAPGRDAPAVVKATSPSGCASYRATGTELAGPVFRRDSGVCRSVWPGPGERAYAADVEAALPALERAVAQVDGRRLQQIILTDGVAGAPLRFLDDALYDTATRAACSHAGVDDDDIRCVPTELAAGAVLFTASCGVAVDVVELPRASCAWPAFAWTLAGAGIVFHAIGDPVLEPLYRFDGGGCRAYTPAADTELRALGPVLDPDPFLRARYFGER